MLTTFHLLTGAAIGIGIKDPYFSLPLAFLSHFVLDALPHSEFNLFSKLDKEKRNYLTKKELFWIFLDIIFGIFILGSLFLRFKNPLILWAAFLAVLPDLIDHVPYRSFCPNIRNFPFFKQFHKFHEFIHFFSRKAGFRFRLFTELFFLIFIFWLLVFRFFL